MPIYEYECSSCGLRFEALHKLGRENSACPRCGEQAKKVIASRFGVSVKGIKSRRPEIGCGRSSPCCGREEPCDIRPCD